MTAEKIAIPVAVILGLLFLANGGYMLIAPESWYLGVPGVADRGGFNQHFIRDIGLGYILTGGAFVAGAVYPEIRLAAWVMAAPWHVAHALFHFWEVAAGICGPVALAQDFAGVTVPSAIGVVLAATAWRARRRIAAAT